MTKIVKETIIVLLMCLCILLALAVGLYEFIPNKKVVPEITRYMASEEVQDLLEDNVDQKDDKDRIILTFDVTKNDLSGYQKSNDYIPRKNRSFC